MNIHLVKVWWPDNSDFVTNFQTDFPWSSSSLSDDKSHLFNWWFMEEWRGFRFCHWTCFETPFPAYQRHPIGSQIIRFSIKYWLIVHFRSPKPNHKAPNPTSFTLTGAAPTSSLILSVKGHSVQLHHFSKSADRRRHRYTTKSILDRKVN